MTDLPLKLKKTDKYCKPTLGIISCFTKNIVIIKTEQPRNIFCLLFFSATDITILYYVKLPYLKTQGRRDKTPTPFLRHPFYDTFSMTPDSTTLP